MPIREFRIFLSSPGDVNDERDTAQRIVHELNNDPEFRESFHLILYRWDDPAVVLPMPADETPQRSVDVYMIKPSACDLVVVLFWSRMGSKLIMDGREYLSGTHYEYLDGLEGRKTDRRTQVWLYRKMEKVHIDLDAPDFDARKQQYDRVRQFFAGFRDDEGRFKGGVNEFPTADGKLFPELFASQLKTYLRRLHTIPEPPPPSPSPLIERPYRGLLPLGIDDAQIFFGRERETLDVLAKLERERFVFIVGASGSGKSSLAAAGATARLRGRGWRVVRCVPGSDPFRELSLGLLREFEQEFGVSKTAILTEADRLAEGLRPGGARLAEQLPTVLPRDARVLLLVDQFEELFARAEKEGGVERVRAFASLLRHPTPNLTILATLRADFFEQALVQFKPELDRASLNLIRPSSYALYEMITRPAALAGLRFDEGLVEDILTAAGDQPGALPLVAFLLEALDDQAKRRGDGRLAREDYDAFADPDAGLNPVEGALSRRAAAAFAALDLPDERREVVFAAVFRSLIELTDDDGRLVPTRRRASLADLTADPDAAKLIAAFTEARLLTAERGVVEVAHEALFRGWAALREWIASYGDDLSLIRRFERDARDWERRDGRNPDLQPKHAALQVFEGALKRLALTRADLDPLLSAYTTPEAGRLLAKLEDIRTSHAERLAIGDTLAIIGDPRDGVGVRPDGIPDIVWLSVAPGGEVHLEGIDNDQEQTSERGKRGSLFGSRKESAQRHGVFSVQPFFIAKFPITYAQFETFVRAGDGFEDERWSVGMGKYVKQSLDSPPSRQPNYPRSTVTWFQSVAFTRWLDFKYRELGLFERFSPLTPDGVRAIWQIRLPTEWEWQWAAQNGGEGREFPWGRWDDQPRANTTEAGINDRSTAVGMYPGGAAACGALDMAGNLWEWCLNKYDKPVDSLIDDRGASRVLRGGSFLDYRHGARSLSRNYHYPSDRRDGYGFRVVVALPIL